MSWRDMVSPLSAGLTDLCSPVWRRVARGATDGEPRAHRRYLASEFGLPVDGTTDAQEALIRQIHTDPVIERTAVFFASYFDAPIIVDWLAEHHVDARYEQRRGEGVSIVMPDGRAFVGDHIVATDGWASPLQRRTSPP